MSRPAPDAPDGRQPARRGPDRIGSSGRWQVLTQTALYELDLDRCVACRHPGTPASLAAQEAPPEVASLRRDHAPIPLLGVLSCRVGAPMILLLDVRGDGIATVRATTAVRDIRPFKPIADAAEDNLDDPAEPDPGST